MDKDFYVLIMAGGGGTRLWPVSRQQRPKQMVRLFDELSMFQMTVKRLDGLLPPERILVVTVADQAHELQRQSPEIPRENFILEPSPRGTASAIGLAAIYLAKINPMAVMAVLPADHYIRNQELFYRLMTAACRVAAEGFLVTLGITPAYAATGYGYIQYGDFLESIDGLDVYRVSGFREKPDQSTAARFLTMGGYGWNSGMFIMRIDTFLAETARQLPGLNDGLKVIASAIGSGQESTIREEVWQNLSPQTIDYGIMEGAEEVAVISAEGLGWNDIGSWESLFETLPLDENGNLFLNSDSISLETRDTLLFDAASQRLVITIGVKDLVIVETSDVLLVCHKDDAQKVRGIVETLKSTGRGEVL